MFHKDKYLRWPKLLPDSINPYSHHSITATVTDGTYSQCEVGRGPELLRLPSRGSNCSPPPPGGPILAEQARSLGLSKQTSAAIPLPTLPSLEVLTSGGPQPRQRASVVLHETTLSVRASWLSILSPVGVSSHLCNGL